MCLSLILFWLVASRLGISCFMCVDVVGYILLYTETSGWVTLTVLIVSQCPWPLCKIYTNSFNCTSKWRVLPSVVLWKPLLLGIFWSRSFWEASMMLSVNQFVGVNKIAFSDWLSWNRSSFNYLFTLCGGLLGVYESRLMHTEGLDGST